MVINLSYEGSLKSHLTVLKEPEPIQTLHDFAVHTTGDIIHINEELNEFKIILESSPIKSLRTLMKDRSVLSRSTSFDDFYRVITIECDLGKF